MTTKRKDNHSHVYVSHDVDDDEDMMDLVLLDTRSSSPSSTSSPLSLIPPKRSVHFDHLQHHHPLPLYRQFWFYAVLLLSVVALTFLTADSLMVRVLQGIPKSTNHLKEQHLMVNNDEKHDSNEIHSTDKDNVKNKPSPNQSEQQQPKLIREETTTTATLIKADDKGKKSNHQQQPNDVASRNVVQPANNTLQAAADIPAMTVVWTDKNAAMSMMEAATKPLTATSTTIGETMMTEIGASPMTFPLRYRGPKLNDTAKAALAATWGQWSFWKDPKAPRPALPCHSYDHCDVPRSQFPPHAWQTDAEFLTPFLQQAQGLVTRAQEAILAEYGQSKFDWPNNMTLAQRSTFFQLDYLNLGDEKTHPPDAKKDVIDNGGWTTSRSFQGLVRRLLHAIVTQDTFTFALGGHSIAAGHGNHFKQSYAMQFHRVMEPVLGRLGVQLNTHNFGHGALGTTQDAMGMGSLWGKEIDFCMWDSGMTESTSSHYDLFARQALISGNRVPVLWNGIVDVMETLHNQADVDIGAPGTGMRGIPITESEQQVQTLPFAAQYLKCARDTKDLCDDHKYAGRCWVDRPDVIPPVKQGRQPGGAAWHHPGFRSTQLSGRVLAFTILTALQEALAQWQRAPNFELPDAVWHVTAHYQNIRTKLAILTTTPCFNDTNMPTPRICHTPMKAVSEYTPRTRPEQNSIRSVMKDTTYIPPAPDTLFPGPDVTNPVLEPPEGAMNYLAIIENDGSRTSTSSRQLVVPQSESHHSQSPASSNRPKKEAQSSNMERRLVGTTLPVGRGWTPHVRPGDIHCNGTYDSDECGRGKESNCLLNGHNDGRGGLTFDSLSGWLLLQLKGVKEGLIIIKLETWLHPGDYGGYYAGEANELTEGWTEENNGVSKRRHLRESANSGSPDDAGDTTERRQLKEEPNVAPDLCPEFMFDFAINGKIESFTKADFYRKKTFVQRVVETLTLLDDPHFASTDVELGIRMRGCKRANVFKLTHVYWA